MRYRPKHILEYVALRLVIAIVQLPPYRALLLVGWVAAAVSFRFRGKSVREAKRRILSVLGADTPPERIHHIAWISWRNLIFNALEILRFPRTSPEWIHKHFAFGNMAELMREEKDAGRSGIMAIPHMGNWEMAALASHVHGFPIVTIAGKQRNPLTNTVLNDLRASTGTIVIERGTSAMRTVLRQLKAGRFMAILPDVRMPTQDLAIPLFGHTSNLGSGMAIFARLSGCAIYPCCVVRDGWSQHRMAQIFPPVYPDKTLDKDEDIARMTNEVIGYIESAILKNPEQWFWYNKRWVLEPLKENEPAKIE